MQVRHLVIPALFCLPLLCHSQTGPEKDSHFSHSVTTQQKPWTKREFLNNPNDFQFAIVTDRTGGMRKGVFPKAVGKINEMQPEFVISVGDLIAGGYRQRDEKEIHRQWDEFNGFVERFEMPFFYLPGNHDVSNNVMDRIWDEKFGVRYYSFVYKDVLFLCLNTQDSEGTRPFLRPEQIAWAKDQLAAHEDVRWTLVFIHQPLWVFEEGIRRNVDGKPVIRKSKTGWPDMETALAGRDHTVYAGHVHRYAKYERNEANYYTLGTTGGGSALRGTAFGEFDHATWITMSDKGPRMINLTLDGMLEEDVTTEAKQKFWRGLRFSENYRESFPFNNKTVTLPIENPLETTFTARLSWILPVTDHWTVNPRRVSIELQPGEKRELVFNVNHDGDVSSYFPLPRLYCNFLGEDGFQLERSLFLPLDLTDHIKKHPERAQISANKIKPEIDGQLNDELWQSNPTISRLLPRQADGYAPVKTEGWLSYDGSSVYVAIRCYEPLLRDVMAEATDRDGNVLDDDVVEVLFDANNDKKSFHRFAINPIGTLYDSRRDDVSWNSTAKIATGKEEDAWTVEMAIPLKELGADWNAHRTWGFQVARHRPKMDERKSYQWSPTFWYGNTMPTFFGKLELQ